MPGRRRFLIGTGTAFVGVGALLGTDAFSSVNAERTVAVNTADDADALLGIEPGSEGGEYVIENGTVEIDITGTNAGGQGVNGNAITAIDQLLEVTNNGTTDVAVGFDATYAENEGDFSNSDYERPFGWTYATNDPEDAALVFWASPREQNMGKTYEDIRPELTTTGFTGSTLVDGTSINDEVGETVPDSGETRRVVSPGESINVGVVVDTRDSTVVDEPIPSELDDSITILAEATGTGGGNGGGGNGGGSGGTKDLVDKLNNDEDVTLQSDYDASSLSYSDTPEEYDGTLDANGQEITNIDVDGTGTGSETGFIDKLASGSEIKNLTVKDSTITGDNKTGFIGSVEGDVTNVTLNNVTVEGDEKVGALAGENTGKITDSSADSGVDGDAVVGGLVGDNFGEIIDSSATGDVTHTGDKSADDWDVGGLVGTSFGKIKRSYAEGNVTGDTLYVGGLVGSHYGEIIESYAVGDVDGDARVGGLVGHNRIGWYNGQVTITDSYATGNVNASGDRVGGLAGFNGGQIETSYAVGNVTASTGASYVGGLVGDNDPSINGTVTDAYWDENATGQTSSEGGGTDLTTSQMQGSTATQNMSAFDFSGTWTTVTSPDDYPILGWQ